jgi:hypothetical protein
MGRSMAVLVVGAVLTFAADRDAAWIDLRTVGWNLMALGAGGLPWTMLTAATKRPLSERPGDVRR